MFVQYLNERQQGALLHYAHEVMRSDNVVEAEELLQLKELRAQTHSGVEAEDVPLDELPGVFEDRLSQVVLLLELVGVAYSDSDFSVQESHLVARIADVLNIDKEDVLGHIESWVRRQYLMMDEARRLMGGE